MRGHSDEAVANRTEAARVVAEWRATMRHGDPVAWAALRRNLDDEELHRRVILGLLDLMEELLDRESVSTGEPWEDILSGLVP